jgi:hypothetical protein
VSKRRATATGGRAGLKIVPAGSGGASKASQITPRVRFSGEFPEPLKGDVPHALVRPELADLDEAAIVALVRSSRAWQEVIVPRCEAIDVRRRKHARTPPLYESETLEAVLLYGRVCGLKTYREIRDRLAGDRGKKIRAELGLDRRRLAPGQTVVTLRSGIPSEATICRHRTKHFPEVERVEAYLELETRLRDEHLEMDGLRREARNLDMDGTAVLTHYTAPIYEKQKRRGKKSRAEQKQQKKLVNGGLSARGYPRITAPDAGYMPFSAGLQWWGHGWELVSIVTQTGVPLAWDIIPAGEASERTSAIRIVREQMPSVIDKLGPRMTRILSADGGFTDDELREACHEIGIHENIHHVSHADKSKPRARRMDKDRIPILGYSKWFSNGHRELRCACGEGRAVKRSALGPDGESIPRVEGQCRNCGSITITSGDWYLAWNPRQWRRVDPRDEKRVPAYLFGNPLTFNDPVAREYGHKRFGHNEGFHSMLGSRYGLTDEKRWFRRRNQVVIECATTFSIMHAVAMEWRRRGGIAQPAPRAPAPPGALAA